MLMLSTLLLTAVLATTPSIQELDPRDAYDVQSYQLAIEVFPETQTIRGSVAIEFLVGDKPLQTFVCDLWNGSDGQPGLQVQEVTLLPFSGKQSSAPDAGQLQFTHSDNLIRCSLPGAIAAGKTATVTISYSGTPGVQNDFTGFHWKKTADGSPWIGTSCQGTGAHWWWPCKASYFNPEDKPERFSVNVTVPKGLYAVSNGRLMNRVISGKEGEERETFSWSNDYGCGTYAVTLNIAPYVVVEQSLKMEGIEEAVPFIYYVLPENAEKAKLQFTQVPELIDIYTEAFGPYPFPKAKFGLVETSFWGMEHSTAVAYGSSYPLWCQEHGEPDRYASRNRYFDYILVHEVAHEWWGNAVSARDWGHFWIHEGFATYAEGVYVERTQGPEAAARFFGQLRSNPKSTETLYRGENKTSGEAYTGLIYSKGALVLNTLRHFVGDDEAWWKSLSEFNLSHRGGNATTEDFCAILERNTRHEWSRFFKQWVYGPGLPTLSGSITASGKKLVIDIDNPTDGGRAFHIPLSIQFDLDGQSSAYRVELTPGLNQREVALPGQVTNLKVLNLEHIAGKHAVTVGG